MSDARVDRFAKVLVEYSAHINPGDRVLIEATTLAEPLVRALYSHILDVGGYPQVLLDFPDQIEIFLSQAGNDQLDIIPPFQKLAYETFQSRIRVQSQSNPRALGGIDVARMGRFQRTTKPLLETQMLRGASGELKWVTTLFPTEGYAVEAGMSLRAYEDFVYRACHINEADPVAYWKQIEAGQNKIIEKIQGHHLVSLHGPNVDLSLSIKGRNFLNSCGTHNMPDGEIFTGPVEDSVNGWVKFTYPAIFNGVAVEGIELTFSKGRVEQAKATKNEKFMLEMLSSDAGARFLGEFAIGTNFEINQFTGNILFDEKIGGSFHMALGAGYPETGSRNKSSIHWDMICDMRENAEISVDHDVFYRNGQFVD